MVNKQLKFFKNGKQTADILKECKHKADIRLMNVNTQLNYEHKCKQTADIL